MWFVIYAKIVDDKEKGLKLAGVFFGGTGKDKTEADKIARECVNTIKGGTILARLYQVSGQQELPRIMAEAEEFFKKKEEQMATAAAILTRPTKKK